MTVKFLGMIATNYLSISPATSLAHASLEISDPSLFVVSLMDAKSPNEADCLSNGQIGPAIKIRSLSFLIM
jgi:hypothetical protein